MKGLFDTTPILAMWYDGKDTIHEAYCSGQTVADSLSKRHEKGQLWPIAYLSKISNPVEVNYEI